MSELTSEQRAQVVEIIEEYISDWAYPDPYEAAGFISERIIEALSRRPDAPSAGEVVEVEPWGYETGEPFAVQPTARVLAEAIGDLATTDRRGLEQRVRGLILRDRATVRQRWEGVQRRAEQAEARAAKLERDLEAFQAALPAPPQADGGEG